MFCIFKYVLCYFMCISKKIYGILVLEVMYYVLERLLIEIVGIEFGNNKKLILLVIIFLLYVMRV